MWIMGMDTARLKRRPGFMGYPINAVGCRVFFRSEVSGLISRKTRSFSNPDPRNWPRNHMGDIDTVAIIRCFFA